MRGLALEGGGARGAYHMGVVKALIEDGCVFDGFVGTSIGAINAALLAQGDFERALELWRELSTERIFADDEQNLIALAGWNGLDSLDGALPNIAAALTKIRNNHGFNMDKMRSLLNEMIDEDKIRCSGKDFGLVTVSLHDRRPYALMLEEIPEGRLLNYIMASASFPGFQPEVIDQTAFLDGAFYDNCPYGLLTGKGYGEVIAVRTNAPGVFHRIQDPRQVKVIVPRQSLGHLMAFSAENSENCIRLGYYDGLRFTRKLRGCDYYIHKVSDDTAGARLMALDDDLIIRAGTALGFTPMPAKRLLFERIVPHLRSYLKLDKDYDYADFAVALLEHSARLKGIPRFVVYTYDDLCALAREAPEHAPKRKGLLPSTGLLGKKRMAATLLADALVFTGD